MKQYETYKDSGIAWIGEIPSEWEMGNFRYYGEFTKGKLPSTTNVEAKGLPIIGASEMLGKECRTFTEDKDVPLCGHDDILILWDGANAGIISSHHTGVVASTAVKYCCLNPDINKNYLYHLFKSLEPLFKEKVNGTTIPHMNIKYINEVPLLIPPINEQRSIATFLDTKCGEIDALISLQEEMISELQAYKQSVITEAVTKGLNPNAKMKDSGVEWIGEIPEEWAVCSTKHLFNLYSGGTPKTDNDSFWDGNIPWITPADFKTEDVYISKGRRNITQNGVDSCGTTIVPANSVIFSKRAPIGLVVLNKEPLCTNQGCISCVPKETFSKYYYYAMSVFTDSYELYGAGTTFKEISATSFANFKLPNPSFEDQHSIATYLDEKTSQIDSLISLKQQKMEALKDYKKSIIYEYVTGKKRV